MHIGLFFGSFNPIHIGHLVIAETLLLEGGLDRIWLMVSPQSPFKAKRNLAPETDRLRMAELATEHVHRIQPSNIEFMLPKPSYTIDTLTELVKEFPLDHKFTLLMGGDNLTHFHKWKKHDVILEEYQIIVYPRPGAGPPAIEHENIRVVEAPQMDISATKIRQYIREHGEAHFYLPTAVHDYVVEKGLYR